MVCWVFENVQTLKSTVHMVCWVFENVQTLKSTGRMVCRVLNFKNPLVTWCVCMYIYIYMCVYIYIYMCMYIYIYIYIFLYLEPLYNNIILPLASVVTPAVFAVRLHHLIFLALL